MGFLIDRSAEQGKDRLAEEEIDCRQHKTAHNTEYDGIANGFVCVFAASASQRNADKSAAAVANKHRDAERDHRQGKYNGVGGVAVRAEIACIGDKNLVNNVIERTHQQLDDAGNGVLPHEFADTLRSQSLTSGIHEKSPFLKNEKCVSPT